MKRLPIALAILVSLLFFAYCQKEKFNPPSSEAEETFDLEAIIENTPIDPDALALEILEKTKWEQTTSVEKRGGWVPAGALLSYDKTYLDNDIAHYTFILAVGPGVHDKIGLHRIVRENSNGKLLKMKKALFHVHGDGNIFATVMLPGVNSPGAPDNAGIAVYLAKNGVDVWGIDLAWSLVPPEITDLSFMEDWGMDRQVRDSRIAMAVARILRWRTGNGVNKMFLSGHSSGGFAGYAILNQEASYIPPLRHVKGFVSMDAPVKTDDETWKAIMKNTYENVSALMESGEYGLRPPFLLIGNLATTDPNGDSPIIPGFTNLQTAIFLFTGGPNSFTHFLAGIWENNLPVGFQFVETDQAISIYNNTAPFQPARYQQDYSLWIAEIEDAPWDDHFENITVPVLSIDPAGGYGKLNSYATSFLGSSDITHLSIQLRPDEERFLDYGHIDIFLANNAEELVWIPIRDWIKKH